MGRIPIITFTDFGVEGPYVGQLETAVYQVDPELRVIHLVSNAPAGDPVRSSYLLAALVEQIRIPAVFLCVVDPGVGGQRVPIIVKAGKSWFVGPDNGLLARVFSAYEENEAFRINTFGRELSETFHGRDLFAPVAAMLASGKGRDLAPLGSDLVGVEFATVLREVIYIDSYGNLFTTVPASETSQDTVIRILGREIRYAPRFEAVLRGELFWYENSCGLVEIAANRDRADSLLNAAVGAPVEFLRGGD